jgi:hypothetical protein
MTLPIGDAKLRTPAALAGLLHALRPQPPAAGAIGPAVRIAAPDPTRRGGRACSLLERAHTLIELMPAMTVMALVLAGTLSCHLMGLNMCQLTKAKLGATGDARKSLGLLLNEVRGAKTIQVGQGSRTTFTQVANGAIQQGNAIQIYPSTNTNTYIRYYKDSTDNNLKRLTNGAATPAVIVHAVSNTVVFAVEDALGTTLTNNQNNRVISMLLQIYQLEDPSIPVGPGGLFDNFRLHARMTRRSLE